MPVSFKGYVTKNDILCSDGAIIRTGAFEHCDGKRVPLVFQHRRDDPGNIIGHIDLEYRPDGVYGVGSTNNSPNGVQCGELIKHGDIKAMSIAARNVQREGQNVVHGDIFEVSLVVVGANPGAYIEEYIQHSAYGDESHVEITTGEWLMHTGEETQEEETNVGEKLNINDIDLESLTLEEAAKMGDDVLKLYVENLPEDKQKELLERVEREEYIEELEAQNAKLKEQLNHGGTDMYNTPFANDGVKTDVLQHADFESAITEAERTGSTLKSVWNSQHSDNLEHSFKNLPALFPDVHKLNNGAPVVIRDKYEPVSTILNGVTKSPFSRLKLTMSDFTEDKLRAKGYITGTQKYDMVYDHMSRETAPQTIYVKDSIDRDNVVDITDFSVVSFIQQQLRMTLETELARAILVGDGREKTDPEKIREDKIRPIAKDNETFTLRKSIASLETFFEEFDILMLGFRGTGTPTLFIDPVVATRLKHLKDKNGRSIYGTFAGSLSQIAGLLGVADVVPCRWLEPGQAILVNLADYHLGSTRGGEITQFEDFDIDFNKHKYLMETRLCGSLMMPATAMVITVTGFTEKLPTLKTDKFSEAHADTADYDATANKQPKKKSPLLREDAAAEGGRAAGPGQPVVGG